jgi:hypothetical protein
MKYTPKSRALRDLLSKRMMQQHFSDGQGEFDPIEPPEFFINSHSLYQEAHAKITAEQDVKLVREIALDYIDSICSTLPDNVATEISRQMNGL